MSELVDIKKYDYEMLDFEGVEVFRVANDEESKAEPVPQKAELKSKQAIVEKQVEQEEIAAEIKEELEEAVPPAASFTEEEVEIAKTVAKDEGFRAGEAAAREAIDKAAQEAQQKSNELLEKINSALPQVLTSLENEFAKMQKASVNLAYGIAKKVVGEAEAQNLLPQIEAKINDACAEIGDKKGLQISLNQQNASELEGKLSGIEIVIDEAILPNDFEIKWQNGFANKKTDVIWSEIAQIIEEGGLQKPIAKPVISEEKIAAQPELQEEVTIQENLDNNEEK